MSFDEFVNEMINKGGIDKDGAYGKQCMDLYNYYCVKCGKLEDGKTGASCAKEILNNSYVMQNVERIDNTPDFVPQKGDIAVGNIGKYGHVCICLGEGNTTYFNSLDQNWSIQNGLTIERHNYLDMGNKLVFLRFKNRDFLNNTFWCRVDKEIAAVRSKPDRDAPLSGSELLHKGDTFECVEMVTGENVDGINMWYKSKKGNYVWSWGITRI